MGSGLRCSIAMDCCDACEDGAVRRCMLGEAERKKKRDATGRQRGEAGLRILAQKFSHSQVMAARREAEREKVRSCVAFAVSVLS